MDKWSGRRRRQTGAEASHRVARFAQTIDELSQELVDFFSGVLENNLEAAQRAKEMLLPRFQREQE